MNNSTFCTPICEAPKHTIILFSRLSLHLTLRQRAQIIQRFEKVSENQEAMQLSVVNSN